MVATPVPIAPPFARYASRLMRFTLALLAALYLFMSLVTFLAFWNDKHAAVRARRRVPESTLHLLELCFGWPGALLAQRVLRHKSAKTSYRLVLWLIILLHLAALLLAAYLHLRS